MSARVDIMVILTEIVGCNDLPCASSSYVSEGWPTNDGTHFTIYKKRNKKWVEAEHVPVHLFIQKKAFPLHIGLLQELKTRQSDTS